MKKIIFILIFALTNFSYAEDIDDIKSDFKSVGIDVPNVSVVYVSKFTKPTTIGTISGNTILIRKDATDKKRVISHELAHIITLNYIYNNKDVFDNYRLQRIGDFKLQNTWYNITAEEANVKMKWYWWYVYSLDVREMVAEDLRYSIYGGDTMLDYTIGPPNKDEIKTLYKILNIP